jgi:hypothetical protein
MEKVFAMEVGFFEKSVIFQQKIKLKARQATVNDKLEFMTCNNPEGRKIQTIGNNWSYLQTSKFVSNSQPFYVMLNPDTQALLVTPQSADYDPVSYLKYLDNGLAADDQ